MNEHDIRKIYLDETVRINVQEAHAARRRSRFWSIVLILLWTPILIGALIWAIDYWWPYQGDGLVQREIQAEQLRLNESLKHMKELYNDQR